MTLPPTTTEQPMTAEQIADLIIFRYCANGVIDKQSIDDIKKYAQSVAQAALNDAAAKYDVPGLIMKDTYGCVCDVPGAITSTEIKTP